MAITSLDAVLAEFEALEELGPVDAYDERMKLVRQLGEALPPMPDALKTDATLVEGCQSKVWVYPLPTSNSDRLHFVADSNTGLTKGIIALIMLTVNNKSAAEVLETDIEKELKPFNVEKHFSSVRTSGVKNMIKKIRETAARLAA